MSSLPPTRRDEQTLSEPGTPEIRDGLSPEAYALLKWQEANPTVWGEQDENGVDIARLRQNLRLTPAERLQRLEAGRRSLRWLQNVRERNTVR